MREGAGRAPRPGAPAALGAWVVLGARVVLGALAAFGAPALAQEPPPAPAAERLVDPARCAWEWRSAGGVGVWAERCALATGLWALRDDPALPGFALTVDNADPVAALQVFAIPPGAGVDGLLPELRRRGYVPDDGECVFRPAEDRPAEGPLAYYEIRPTGARLAAFEATPPDLIPDPPCGAYGWSTHGVRYFMTDARRPGRALYVNIGQDGMMFDESTARLE